MKKSYLFILVFLFTELIFSQTHSVTFQVDMNVHKNYGVFDPALSSVLLRGSFNGWNDQTPMDDSDNDGIYTLTYEGIESGIILYKFFYKNVNGQDAWEEIPDRSADITSDTTLAVVYFMNDEGTSKLLDVYFQVNMEIEIAANRFDPATDFVYATGNFNGWSEADTCYPSALDPNVYETSTQFLASLDDTIHYKFKINGEGWEVDFPNNTGGHRLIGISQEDLDNGYAFDPFIYPSEYFNGMESSTLTQQPIEIKFVVDMNNASDLNGTLFPAIENVFLCGGTSPLSWAWETENKDNAIFMFDDGTNGDEIANDNFWTCNVTFPIYTSLDPIVYKFGANYDLPSNNGLNDNENYAGDDHWIQLTTDISSATVRNIFGVATTEDNPHPLVDVVTEIKTGDDFPNSYQLCQNYPNPFNPTTEINFSLAQSGVVKLSIYNTKGEKIVELINNEMTSGNHTVNFNAKNLSSGVYFYSIKTNNFSAVKKMMLIK